MNLPAKIAQGNELDTATINAIIDFLAQLQIVPGPGMTASPGGGGTQIGMEAQPVRLEVRKSFHPEIIPSDTPKLRIGVGYGQYGENNPVAIGPVEYDALIGMQVYVTCTYATNAWAIAWSSSSVPLPTWTTGVWIVAEVTATELLWRRQSDIQIPFSIREMKVCELGFVKTINILSSSPV